MGKEQVTPPVMEYITKRPGQMLYLNDICSATRFTPQQVMTAISQMKTRRPTVGNDIEVLQRGRIWMYRPGTHKDESENTFIVERVGLYKEGVPLVRDEDGKMYALVPVTLDI